MTISPSVSRLAKPAVAIVFFSLTLAGCGAINPASNAGDAATPEVVSTATQEAAAPVETSDTTTAEETTEETTEQSTDTGAATGNTVQPGGTLTDGSVVSAELTRAGQKDVFKLDLGDAREFYIADMHGDNIQFQAFSDVDDQPVGLPNLSLSFGTWVMKFTKSGTHRLEIWGDTNVVGQYGFRIATVKPRTFPVAIGMKIGEGSPAGAGRLDVSGRVERFEFDSDGASAIKVIGGTGACTAIELELVDAAYTEIANARMPIPLCGYESDLPLSNGDGKYALIVRSNTAKTGPYSFQIVRGG
ncbi:hypothetical protein [Acrocarpospora catenulata]|uniref:hypothetical protein n=1 Tax=Acrocarpospora catenulata TaxID=2836182 RepID=UPI001BDA0D7A|nr:hypothetical protein [Acrocarpospora catenulata]